MKSTLSILNHWFNLSLRERIYIYKELWYSTMPFPLFLFRTMQIAYKIASVSSTSLNFDGKNSFWTSAYAFQFLWWYISSSSATEIRCRDLYTKIHWSYSNTKSPPLSFVRLLLTVRFLLLFTFTDGTAFLDAPAYIQVSTSHGKISSDFESIVLTSVYCCEENLNPKLLCDDFHNKFVKPNLITSTAEHFNRNPVRAIL